MILHIENPKDSIRKLLELICEFSEVAGYKINTQKSLAILYPNNEKSEKEIKESTPFTIENVCCRLVIYGLYYVEVGSFYVHFLKHLYHKWVLKVFASIEMIIWF